MKDYCDLLDRAIGLATAAYEPPVSHRQIKPSRPIVTRPFQSTHWRPPQPTPQTVALKQFLKGLSEAELNLLMTMMYVGRGDIPARSLQTSCQQIRTRFQERGHVVSQMCGKGANLVAYLKEARLRLAKADMDAPGPRLRRSSHHSRHTEATSPTT